MWNHLIQNRITNIAVNLAALPTIVITAYPWVLVSRRYYDQKNSSSYWFMELYRKMHFFFSLEIGLMQHSAQNIYQNNAI